VKYQKPTVEKFGAFRDLTLLGLNSSTDGASIFGVVSSPGCQTTYRGTTFSIGCPVDPTAS